jgi:hypothetical protein
MEWGLLGIEAKYSLEGDDHTGKTQAKDTIQHPPCTELPCDTFFRDHWVHEQIHYKRDG